MEGFVSLQIRLQPALVAKPLCRLVPATSTFECILLDALNDVTDVSEATKLNFLQGAVRVELSSSEKGSTAGACASLPVEPSSHRVFAGGDAALQYPAGFATSQKCDRICFISANSGIRAAASAPTGTPFTIGKQMGLFFPDYSAENRETADKVLIFDLLDQLRRDGCGWKYDDTAQSLGKDFVEALGGLLWMLTDQWEKFATEGGYALPEAFAAYKDRRAYKKQKKSKVVSSNNNECVICFV